MTFKFFNYGKVGHYDSMCSEKKKEEYGLRENSRKVQKDRKKVKSKIFYT